MNRVMWAWRADRHLSSRHCRAKQAEKLLADSQLHFRATSAAQLNGRVLLRASEAALRHRRTGILLITDALPVPN